MPASLSGSYQDSHGGFHGDGLAFGQIVFSAADGADIAAMLSSRESWQPFPISENLTALLYGDVERQSILTDTGILPEIQEGYWYFYDRFPQSTDRSSDRELLSRAAYNFTAALYDVQQYTLYYIEFDT